MVKLQNGKGKPEIRSRPLPPLCRRRRRILFSLASQAAVAATSPHMEVSVRPPWRGGGGVDGAPQRPPLPLPPLRWRGGFLFLSSGMMGWHGSMTQTAHRVVVHDGTKKGRRVRAEFGAHPVVPSRHEHEGHWWATSCSCPVLPELLRARVVLCWAGQMTIYTVVTVLDARHSVRGAYWCFPG